MEKSAKATRCTYSVAPILQLVAVIGVMVWAWSVWAGSGAPRAAAAEYVAASIKASAVAPAGPPEPTAQADAPIAAAHPISARIDPAWLDAASARTGIPRPALAAYAGAASALADESPQCHLGWNTLAAIGHIESDDGRYGGAVLSENGYPSTPIVGPALDGGAFAGIHDSDGGRWDGDTVWDHALGPFQFIPRTWRTWGADGNGDGQADPNQMDDAALTAARYLCHAGDLSTVDGWRRAALSYNHSESYLDDVAKLANSYHA